MTTGFARVQAAIRHTPGVPVPRGELVLDLDFARSLWSWRRGTPPPPTLPDHELLLACCRTLKLDLICLHAEGPWGGEAAPPPGPETFHRMIAEGLFVFWVVNGAFQSAMARGGMAFLLDLARTPGEAGRELQRRSRRVVDTMAAGVAAGAQGIVVADDIAYQRGTYVSPEGIERDLLPLWRAQVQAARDLGVPVFLHSDGNLNGVLPHIAAAGFDGLQGLEPAAGMDMAEVVRRCGHRLCLMGNLDPSLLVAPEAPPDLAAHAGRLRRAVGAILAAAAGGGGVIFGTCSGLQAGMAPDLADGMYRLAAELEAAAGPG